MKGRHVYHSGGLETFFLDGREVSQEEYDAAFPDRPIGDGSGLTGWKPLHSDGAAVHPDQIPEAMESAKKHGCPTEFDQHGRPIFTSRSHRRQYLKAYGFHDNRGSYGDG